eukprot:1043107-Pyramimonas_sp.AAC.1
MPVKMPQDPPRPQKSGRSGPTAKSKTYAHRKSLAFAIRNTPRKHDNWYKVRPGFPPGKSGTGGGDSSTMMHYILTLDLNVTLFPRRRRIMGERAGREEEEIGEA